MNQNTQNQEFTAEQQKKIDQQLDEKVRSMLGQKKSWWERRTHDERAAMLFVGGAVATIGSLIGLGIISNLVAEASKRATINSPGFQKMLERGVLDPPPPPKNLEEAAARSIERGMRMLPIEIDADSMIFVDRAA